MTDFDSDRIASRFKNISFVKEIHIYQSISSTNAVAHRLAEAGAPTGTLVLADRQTAGRGRFGRRWDSPARLGLWFSVILRPEKPQENWQLLPMILSEILSTALSDYCQGFFTVKWPNDVLFEQKKICGILCEASSSETPFEYIIAGIGINVNQDLADFPVELRAHATSLKLIMAKPFDRVELLAFLLKAFSGRLLRMAQGAERVILQSWNDLCRDIGRAVLVKAGDRQIMGIFQQVSANGKLIVRDEMGRLHEFSPGQATLQRIET